MGTTLLIIAGGAAVLALGGLGGVALRRMRAEPGGEPTSDPS